MGEYKIKYCDLAFSKCDVNQKKKEKKKQTKKMRKYLYIYIVYLSRNN